MEQKEIREQLIATVRDMLLTSCEQMGAQSIEHCWTRHDGTEVKLGLSIYLADEKEEDPERELRTYAKAALVVFGEDSQIDKAIEEMAELTKALLKYKQAKHGTPGIDKMVEAADSVREEREDVRIMMAQLEILFGDAPEWRSKKMAHLKELVTVKKPDPEERGKSDG